MMSITNESILVFEYFTASGEKDKSIISEAEALVCSLIEDLKNFDIHLIINESFKYIADKYDNVTPILINGSLEDYLKENSKNFSRAIFISAENDNNLYNLTKILEDNDVLIYSSISEACLTTSDKFQLYELLYDVVPQPRSFKFKIDSKGYWKRAVTNLYKKWQAEYPLIPLKIIIKPINDVDCENVFVFEDIDDLSYDLEKVFPPESRIIVQEFMEGEDVSVSLIVNNGKAIPLAVNKQYIDISEGEVKYLGGMTPYKPELERIIKGVAVKACEAVQGLKGFVGVDLKVNMDKTNLYNVYLLEINSRFTTPYVGLQKIADFNIAESIIKLSDYELDFDDLKENISFTGSVEFKKSGNDLLIKEL